MSSNIRSSLLVTYETWKALFVRDALIQLSKGREALWIIIDPIEGLVILILIFSFLRMRSVGGIDTVIWLMVGVLSYDIFKNAMMGGKNAVNGNKPLFTYRQIRPIDFILVECCMAVFIKIIVAIILFLGVALFGINVIPADPLAVLAAVFGLWLIGIAAAFTLSIAELLIPGASKINDLLMRLVYVCSGVIFPISRIPQPYRQYLELNPLLHGVEAARLGFAPYYHATSGLSISYIYSFAVVYLFLGLALQVRFSQRLMKK
jgi:capsular polysaccharide transport system permease protein